MKMEKSKIESDLRRIGLEEGTHVAVALSMRSIGHVEGGSDAFLDAILDVIGPEGTLMMNAHTRVFPLSDIDSQYVFDSQTSLPWTGIVPSALMKRKNAIRSRHPVCSVVAIGKHARFLTEDHDENSKNELLPYAKLAQIDGYYLCIGTGDNFVAIRHEAQRRAGLFVVPKFTGVMYRNRQGEIKPYISLGTPCTKTQPQLVPQLVAEGIVKRGYIGMASSTISSAKELIEEMASILRNDPMLNLCRDGFCLECRELERRLNLYDRIEKPRVFQKNLAARKLIELRNRLVLKRYTILRIRNSKQNKEKSLSLLAERRIPEYIGLVLRTLRKQTTESKLSLTHAN